ncbi:MAG: MFS transporter [Dehalococcoidia bacterium]|nr:MAG: MFS transporter [Dehalococcoidia bacterium]
MPKREASNLTAARKPRFFYGYVIVLLCFFIMLLMFGTFYSFGVFFKPLSAEFGWTRTATSGAYSLAAFLSGLLAIVMGRLTDRFGPRIVMTLGGFLLGLGYLLMSQVSAIWQLYLFYGVVVGVGMSGAFVPPLSTVARWFVKRRGIMTGFVVAGIGIGTLIIPPAATWLIESLSWSTAYIVIGAIALVLIILAAQFLRLDPRQMGLLPDGEKKEAAGLNLHARGFSLREAMASWQLWVLFAILFCFGYCLHTIIAHIANYATDIEISATVAAGILAVIGGLSILGRIATGSITDRVGSKSPLIVNLILMSGALFWLVVTGELWMLYLFAVIFGFAYGGLAAMESPIVAELFGLSSHGVVMGVASFGFTAGGAVGPLVAGRVFDMLGSYQIAFLICAVVGISGIILAWLLRPPVGKGDR